MSILKFIEANWGLTPLSQRSLDNLPNPTSDAYVPENRPAIGDLMSLFDFPDPHFATPRLPAAPAQASGAAVRHNDLDR